MEAVPHRHAVMTMPRFLRRVFLKRRELLLDLAQSGAEAIGEYVRRELGEGLSPGIVVSIASACDMVQWHPHLHILVTAGGFSVNTCLPAFRAWMARMGWRCKGAGMATASTSGSQSRSCDESA